ncbi:MAG: heavy metal translocating P-type ATPase, partial [Clostridia bacterium]|nr:heavy metal translocating P-type ATPase [Clostridia bacterium]
MKQFEVTGMSCAACSARIEKAVGKVPGVTSCAVSLLTNSMGVEGSAEDAAVVAAVEKAGYGAKPKGGDPGSAKTAQASNEELLKDTETPKLLRRLAFSAGFLLVLMYLTMGHMMWNWPLPAFLEGNHAAMGLAEMLLSGAILVINQRFFISGFKSLFAGAPNMDTLVAVGSSISYLWSVIILFVMTGAEDAASYMPQLYFESAAMILTLITVGKMLEARSKGKTTDALKSLMKLAPKKATLLLDGEEKTVPIEAVKPGDVFGVRPGESVPVDGVVLSGVSAVNEASLTGESVPVDKKEGDAVSAATINESGFLTCRATRVGEDTTLAQIIKMVGDAAATKAPIARLADRVAGFFVPVVLGLALVTTVIWLFLGASMGDALARGIAVTVISCPCALGLATPVAVMVGNGVGARNGVLFKTAVSLEETGRIQIVALDKTGTITEGTPHVVAVRPAQGVEEEGLIRAALTLEEKSEHPLSRAVTAYAKEKRIAPEKGLERFEILPGSGLKGELAGKTLSGGSLGYIATLAEIDPVLRKEAEKLSDEGKTPLFFLWGEKLLGFIAVADVIKETSADAIRDLKSMGIRVVMLTGDNRRTAHAVGREAGVDTVVSEVLPDGKESVIRALGERGKVAMVGDGVNDAPALTRADIGV